MLMVGMAVDGTVLGVEVDREGFRAPGRACGDLQRLDAGRVQGQVHRPAHSESAPCRMKYTDWAAKVKMLCGDNLEGCEELLRELYSQGLYPISAFAYIREVRQVPVR